MVALCLDKVAKRFGDRTVFRGVCAEVRSGECLVVAGRNGSGKSTLLAILAGLLRPDAGSVRLLSDERELEPGERRQQVGLVAPDLTLYPELTADENLRFFARVRGVPWTRAETEAALEPVGLAGRADDPVGTYSSGMRVRLKYAVALQTRPAFLLLDEPTAMLDESGVAVVESVIARQRERGVTVLATNDRSELRHGDLLLELGDAPGGAGP